MTSSAVQGSPEEGSARELASGALGLALRLTLLILLLDASLYWFQRVPLLGLAGLGLVVPRLLTARAYWLGLLLLTAWPLAWNWPFSDNHDYLRALWVLGISCAIWGDRPREILAWNGRTLIGLTFAFAALWKLGLSPDFLDGSFFRVTLLTDGRFHDLAMLGGGLSAADIEAFGAALDATLAGAPWADSAFQETARFRTFAGFLTAFTGLSELAIALCFLWPPGGLPARLRNPLLLGFAVATYAFATVRGFGWLLATMAVAQCRPEEPRARIAFIALVFLIEIYRSVPWTTPILEALGKF